MRRICNFVLALILMLGLISCAQSTEAKWQEQYNLGVRYLSEGNYEEAIIAFTAAIEIDAKRPDAYIGRGGAYIGAGETEENLATALADYKAVLNMDDSFADAWLGLADVYIRMGDYDTALEIIREAAEKTNGDSDVLSKLEDMENGIFEDSSGRLRQEITYDETGSVLWRFVHSYDSMGREAAVTSYDGQGICTGHVDLAYDERGRQIVSYGKSTAVIRRDLTYDDQDNLVEEVVYGEDGQVEEFMKYTYNDGLETMCERYEPDGVLWSTLTFEYDSAGNMVRQNDYRNGALAIYDTYEYDKDGNQVKSAYYDGPTGELLGYEVFLYDDHGNYVGTENYDADGSLLSTTVAW